MDRNINIESSREDELEIDLGQLWKLMKKNIRLIIIVSVLLGIAASLYTMFFINKTYMSTTRIYLTPKVTDQGYVDNGTVNSNNIMINNYVSMLKGKTILTKVADELGLVSVGEVAGGLSVSNDPDTQIINVTVTTNDPIKSKQIADTTVKIFFREMKENLNITKMTVLDEAQINNMPVSPNIKKNIGIGILAGLILSCGYVFLKYLLDKRLRNRNEAESYLGLPVLAEIPYYEE